MDHPKFRTDEDGNLLLHFGEYGQEVEVACFSGDGRRLLAVQEVGVARVWDVDSPKLLAEIRPTSPLTGSNAGPTTYPFEVFIEAAALNATGDLALLGLNDGTAGIFTVADGMRRTTIHHPDRRPAEKWELIRAVSFSPDGSLVVVGFYGRCAGVWDVRDGSMVALLRTDLADRLHHRLAWGRDTLVSTVAISADNRFVFAGHADMTATLWELATGRVVFDAYEHSEDVLDLWLENDTVRWATMGGTVWEAKAGRCTRRLNTRQMWSTAAFAPDGRRLLAQQRGGEPVSQWSMDGTEHVLSDADTNDGWIGLFWSSQSDGLSPKNGQTSFFPVSDAGSALAGGPKTMLPDAGFVSRKAMPSPSGDLLATHVSSIAATNATDRIMVWRVPSGELAGEMPVGSDCSTVAITRDGTMLAAGTFGQVTGEGFGPPRTISLWSITDKTLLCRWPAHDHQIHFLDFLPDGRHLVSTSLDRTVKLWRLDEDGAGVPPEIARLEYEDLEFGSLLVLSDGRIVVFRSQSIEVWRDLQEMVADLPAGINCLTRWRMSADERLLAIARGRQTIEVWSLDSGRQQACHTADIFRPEVVPAAHLA